MLERCPQSDKQEVGKLPGYEFFINGRGFANIRKNKNKNVYGIVYDITDGDEKRLDGFEGVQYGTNTKERSPSLDAYYYIAQNTDEALPKKGYLEKIIAAAEANNFSKEYVSELESWLKKDKKEQLAQLIRRGVHITQAAQEGDILYADDPADKMHEAFKDYHNWKMEVRDFFLKHDFDNEAAFFFEADDVPMLKGGLEYSYIETPKSQKLLKSIREETSKKLAFLREFSKELDKGHSDKQKERSAKEKMDFDSQNGVLRYGEIKSSFHRGTKSNKPRLQLFRKLWEERRNIKNGKIIKKGEAFPVKALAEQVEVSEQKIQSMIKGFKRMLREKGFPADIERKNGILLLVAEK